MASLFFFLVFLVIFAMIGWFEGYKRGSESTQISSRQLDLGALNLEIDACSMRSGADLATCVERLVLNSREQQRAELDLRAQQQMAEWAKWMLIASLLMAPVTAVGVVFVWQTLKSTQEMAAETKEIGEAQVRAYLSYDREWISCDEAGDWVVISVQWKNAGASPALNCHVEQDVRFVFDKDGLDISPGLMAELILSDPLRAPVGNRTLAPSATAFANLHKMPITEFIDCLNGGGFACIYSHVRYKDVFGRTWFVSEGRRVQFIRKASTLVPENLMFVGISELTKYECLDL